MTCKKWITGFALLTVLFSIANQARAEIAADEKFRNPFYVGIEGGYGSTTWDALVPSARKASTALALSTPTNVSEGGAVWGAFAGWELIPQFAVELNYTRYPSAHIYFSKKSLFSFRNKGRTEFTSNTENYGAMAKFMIIIPRTTIRAFSAAGVAGVHRSDVLANRWRASPTFSFGFNYNLTPQWLTELGVNYTGGYGESELTPTDDYVPFLYSVYLRVGYRF
jgi:hypothetical protein